MHSLFRLLKPHKKFLHLITLMKKYFLRPQKFGMVWKNSRYLFGVSYRKVHETALKIWALEAKYNSCFCQSFKNCKRFSDIDYRVNSDLQKWIISQPHAIQSPIDNYSVQVNFYGVNSVENGIAQRGLVVRAKYFGISSCSWSQVQDRGFESLRNFRKGRRKSLGSNTQQLFPRCCVVVLGLF